MNARDDCFSTFECLIDNGLRLRGSLHSAGLPHAPCVIFCHGFTGHRFGPGYLFVKLSRTLADAGIASVRFDFCGAGESEGLFSEMHTETMMRDLRAVAADVRKRLAPARLILFGHSFGGMIAARCAKSTEADGLILLSPVGDPRGLIRQRKALLDAGTNRRGFYENGPHEMSLMFLDRLLGFDPVQELVSSFSGKMLLIHGDRDPSVSVDESYRYAAMAKEASIAAEYHLLTGADHNYSRVSDVTAVIDTTVAWIKEHYRE
ncbi:MAG: alpha/beta fold hydrolase [Chitinispirillaceae bacterium]|nr:alpha/beta fold hydrolase [Chitinispirillaceae bacterium]